MASSQVEIVSPFGCVLRDRNRRDRCSRESNAKAAASFQRNLNELVRDHLHTCISVSSDSLSDENSKNHINNIDSNHKNLRCMNNSRETNVKNNSNESLTMSSKQARFLQQWAAKQAQEMVSTIEGQSKEAALLIAPSRTPSPTPGNSQNSASKSESSSESGNLGASSLVQIWEARLNRRDPRLNRSYSMNSNTNPVSDASRTSFLSSDTENAPSFVDEPSRRMEMGYSATNDDSSVEWDSTAPSAPSGVNVKTMDASEQERGRVADIIKRLTSDCSDHEQQVSSAADCTFKKRRTSSGSGCGSDLIEQRALPLVVSSPKIRGRQAFKDLLLQMEQERHRELDLLADRRAVSKFAQRGRIQSLLRLRFLQRGLACQDQQRPSSAQSTASSDTCRSQGSTIMHLREIFAAGVEQDKRISSEATTPTSTIEIVNSSSVNRANSSGHNLQTQDARHHQEISTTYRQSRSLVENSLSCTHEIHEDVHEQTSASSDVTVQGTSLGTENFDQQETSEATPSLNEWDDNEIEEEEADEQQDFEESNFDWFSDIARPRSYWEDRRKEWYQEMLTSRSDNDEIRQLLERRTVSSFLDSDLRDRIDQLMVAHVQRQVNQVEELDEENVERMGQLMLSYFQMHSHAEGSQGEEQELEVDEGRGREGEGEAEEEEEEEEHIAQQEVLQQEADESASSHQYLEATDYFGQSSPSMHSPSPFRSWNYSYDHQVGHDSEQASTTPFCGPMPSQASNEDRRYSASISRSSMETELIYDLKEHMEQLQSEMSELRKSIQSCIEMQMNMQKSSKQEVCPVQKDLKNSHDGTTKQHSCRICHEMPVNSFLYRCGHMCTCLKCAHELQQISGKCPICQAPILDVVQAYLDS